MIKSLGKLPYFRLKKTDLGELADSDFVEFTIGGETFTVSVKAIRKKFSDSVDWNKSGVHKASSSVPRWIRAEAAKAKSQAVDECSVSEVRAAQIWGILVGVAKAKTVITYGEVAERLGCHHRPLRYALSHIQDAMLAKEWPALTVLVVNKSGLPGEGFIAGDVSKFDEILQEVYAFGWEAVESPFAYIQEAAKINEAFLGITSKANPASYYYVMVKSRGACQLLFKSLLLGLYKSKCAFCALSFHEALEAAHILPWSRCIDRKDRIDPRNGILLCSTHHRLFDCGWLTVDDDYNILFSDPLKNEGEYSEDDHAIAIKIHQTKMTLPDDQAFWPDVRFLKFHREEVFS